MVSTCPYNGHMDVLDPDNFVEKMPYEELLELRRTEPVRWWEDPGSHGGGFWFVTRYDDVVEVSRHPKTFSSYERLALLERSDKNNDASLDMQRMMMLNLDPPEHTRLRAVVNKGFTPRVIGMLRGPLEERTERILSQALEKGEGDFVVDVAAELPLEAIAELMGVPFEDRHKLFDWSNRMIGSQDPDYAVADADANAANAELYQYAARLGHQKRTEPVDDIVSRLVTAEVDGHTLSEAEFEMFFLLLAVAGNETTRNAISHGMQAFLDHPDQWDLFKRERPLATAADEIIRWATPVMIFQRTATQDTVLGGQQIKAGERVAISYSSANRDPEHFDNPHEFDITRDPNPHIAFGGGGPHFCLGNHLAKLEVEIMFEQVAERMPDIAQIGPAARLRSSFINGIKHLPVRYSG